MERPLEQAMRARGILGGWLVRSATPAIHTGSQGDRSSETKQDEVCPRDAAP